MENLSNEQKKEIKNLFNLFKGISGATITSIKGYESSTSGEIANHLVVIGYNYGKAIEHDLNALKSATNEDVTSIAEKGNFKTDLVKFAIDKLISSFEKNKNEETASEQSKAQSDSYLQITNGLRLHIETGKIYLYGATLSKTVLVQGTFKEVNSRELTLCQNAVKKHFNFKTVKFRQYVLDPEQLSEVKAAGQTFQL